MHVSQKVFYQSLRDFDYSLSPNKMNCIIRAPSVPNFRTLKTEQNMLSHILFIIFNN